MRRRDFISLVGGAAAWPVAARAQPAMPVIGYLNAGPEQDIAKLSFLKGLQETGYVEGLNLRIEYRYADFRNERLPALAADLVQRRVSVIAAIGAPNAPIAAKAATATIPIVFSTGGDPVALGLVARINRPGGNITGASFLNNLLGSKRLELLRELVPMATSIGFLSDSTNPNNAAETKDMQDAADALGRKLVLVHASTEREIEAAFATLMQVRAQALSVASQAFFTSHIDQLVSLARRYALPAIYSRHDYAESGGLMSYGTDPSVASQQAGLYVGRILKGERPADLPVVQSTKFEFVLNLKTAKALGLTVSNQMQLLADEVIE